MEQKFLINYKIVLTCNFADVGILTVTGPKICKKIHYTNIFRLKSENNEPYENYDFWTSSTSCISLLKKRTVAKGWPMWIKVR